MFKTIKQQRLDFLQDTVNYYSEDVSRRAAVDTDICKYLDENTGNKCAIGRWIKYEDYRNNMDIEGSTVNNYKIFALLPDEIRRLGKEFLMNIQYLHDSNRHWYSEGLTDYGIKLVNKIKEKYCN